MLMAMELHDWYIVKPTYEFKHEEAFICSLISIIIYDYITT